MSSFDGKTVLVTGASRGLGRAMAERLGRAGAYVVVGYRRRAEDAAEALSSVRAAGGDGEIAGFDVTRPEEVERAVRGVEERRGPLDALINNAGIVDDAPFAMMDASRWARVIGTDLDGTFHVCRAVVAGMLRRKAGAIVNVSSTSALRCLRNQANYAAAKGGVVALTRSLAAELAPHGIRVNAVLPGLIAAGMGERLPHDVVERLRTLIPAGRLGRAPEVAEAVAFLASDSASYLTGQIVAVDGGLSL